MAIETYEEGDTAECEHCGKQFEINNDNDFDNYFEHVTCCDGPESEDDDEDYE